MKMSEYEKSVVFIINLSKEYCSIKEFRKLRLVNKRLNEKFTPLAFQSLTNKTLIQPNTLDYLTKYGKYVTEIICITEVGEKSGPWKDIQSLCPNIKSLNIDYCTSMAAGNYNNLIRTWPRLTSISIDGTHDIEESLKQLTHLKHIQLSRYYPKHFDLAWPFYDIESVAIRHYSLDLDFLYQLSSLQPKLKFLEITIFFTNPRHLHLCSDLFQILLNFQYLEGLKISITVDDDQTESYDSHLLEFVNIVQFKSLEIIINRVVRTRFRREFGLRANRLEGGGTEVRIPISLNHLFGRECDQLTSLVLSRIDASLIESLLLFCPNLVEMSCDSVLPKLPLNKSFQFRKLKKFTFAGFSTDCIAQHEVVKHIFPSLISIRVKKLSHSLPLQPGTNDIKWAGHLFPSVSYVATDKLPFDLYHNTSPLETLAWIELSIDLLYRDSVHWIETILPKAPHLVKIKILEIQHNYDSGSSYIDIIKEMSPSLEIICLD